MSGTLLLALALLTPAASPQEGGEDVRRLIGRVAVSARHVVFSHAGDLWRIDGSGGEAVSLTSGPAEDAYPVLSHDGSWVAFGRRGVADWDVYLIPVNGGEARRLTHHPESDQPRAWSRDDASVVFRSHRDEEGIFRLYRIGVSDPFPTPLPLPRAEEGSFAPEGDRIAYVPFAMPTERWRHYRGGMAAPIWIADLADSSIEPIPRDSANDRFPMWVGDTIYFVSDRTGTFNLFAYPIGALEPEQLTSYTGYGITHAAAGGGRIALVQDGGIRLYTPSMSTLDTLAFTVSPDTSELIPRDVGVGPYVQAAAISHIGDKVAFEARGDIIVFDRLSGTAQNLTSTPGAAERVPALSPDGQWIAYASDESGEYQLKMRRLDGSIRSTRTSAVELRPTYYRELSWSPDAEHVAFIDKRLSLWVADAETGGARRVSTSPYSAQGSYQVSWSPNGTILAYSEHGPNHNRVVYLYDVVRGRTRQVTGPEVSAAHPAFDRNGKYLYVITSSNSLQGEFGWSVLSGMVHRPRVTRRLQVVSLRRDTPPPVWPAIGQPNEEVLADTASGRALIHTDGIDDRIAPLPLPPRDYIGLVPGSSGELFLLANEWPQSAGLASEPTRSLYRYRLAEPTRLETFVEDIDEFAVSADRSAILYRRGDDWSVVPISEPPANGIGALDLSSVTVRVEPRAEWRQMYHEAWRLMRDFFYDPQHHGNNIRELEAHYATYLPSLTRRSDLNELLGLALGHISVSHLAIGGGDIPPASGDRERIGLLGADYAIEDGRYRVTRIYQSGHYDSPNRLLRAPLDQPGIDVREGSYITAVDGESITPDRNIYSYFAGKAMRPTRVTFAPQPSGAGSRTFTVVPLPGENTLRRANWAAANRRSVEERTQGQIRYIYVANYVWGLDEVFREIHAFRDRKGFVIDQRFALGGVTSDYLIETLSREAIYYYAFRHGSDLAVPTNPMPNSKVLITNNLNGSAAETFALMFKLGRVGRIIGTRTLGAGIGPYVYVPRLIDGGRVSIPNRAAYNPSGSWDIENDGVAPNIEVELLPEEWRRGEDPQLDQAVRSVLQHIVDNADRVVQPVKPEYPVHSGNGKQ